MKTLDEWFPSGRGDGRKFVFSKWEDQTGTRYFEPLARTETSWIGLDKENLGESYLPGGSWLEYHPPKPKITRWLWTDKTGVALSSFAANHEEIQEKEYGQGDASIDIVKNYWIKLEWSAQEFEI